MCHKTLNVGGLAVDQVVVVVVVLVVGRSFAGSENEKN